MSYFPANYWGFPDYFPRTYWGDASGASVASLKVEGVEGRLVARGVEGQVSASGASASPQVVGIRQPLVVQSER